MKGYPSVFGRFHETVTLGCFLIVVAAIVVTSAFGALLPIRILGMPTDAIKLFVPSGENGDKNISR
jgi:hypothetical protein